MSETVMAGALEAQLDTLRRELMRAGATLKSAAIDKELRLRVEGRFDIDLAQLEVRRLALVVECANNQPRQALWPKLRDLQAAAMALFDECLSLIEGALARDRQLDDGLCRLADSLLDDLSSWSNIAWGRFVLMGTSEKYRETAAVIRLRFPELSAWSLPLAAHEFGHFIGPELRESPGGGPFRYPFQDLSTQLDQGRQLPLHNEKWHHLQEQFADLFATYALGPAYAAAFILLRTNPTDDKSWTHPSAAQRVHGILWTLEKMQEDEGAAWVRPPFGDLPGRLRRSWAENCRSAGQPEALPDAGAAVLGQRMGDLWDMLSRATPGRLRYSLEDWRRAESVAEAMRRAIDQDTVDTLRAADGVTRRDVLNGMWLARLGPKGADEYVVKALGRAAVLLYKQIPALEGTPAKPDGH